MKSIDLMYQTMLAEWGQRSLDGAWTADFPSESRFTAANVKGRRYWYFDIPDGHGGTKRRYVGPADDPDVARRVGEHKRDKDVWVWRSERPDPVVAGRLPSCRQKLA